LIGEAQRFARSGLVGADSALVEHALPLDRQLIVTARGCARFDIALGDELENVDQPPEPAIDKD
jgi:hypothetical protein